MKRIYGVHFAGVWVDQVTRQIIHGEEGFYSPARAVDGALIPSEYVVCSGLNRVMPLFFKYFDRARRRVDPTHQLVLLSEPLIIEYRQEQILSDPRLRGAILESCMADYFGWEEGNLSAELSDAVSGKPKYEELF